MPGDNVFIREDRYLVLKRSDIHNYLTLRDIRSLMDIQDKIDQHRELEKKDSLEYVVVESDWPEYEPVWKMIEDRCNGK